MMGLRDHNGKSRKEMNAASPRKGEILKARQTAVPFPVQMTNTGRLVKTTCAVQWQHNQS